MAVRRKARKKSEDLLGEVVEAVREHVKGASPCIELREALAAYDQAIDRELDEDERLREASSPVAAELPAPTSEPWA
jgi:hypothetical protein